MVSAETVDGFVPSVNQGQGRDMAWVPIPEEGPGSSRPKTNWAQMEFVYWDTLAH